MNEQPSWQKRAAHLLTGSDLDTLVTLCELLGNRRRQLVVFGLATREGWISVREVSRWVTAVFHDCPIGEATGKEYKNVRESMRHTHLDVLNEADAIEVNDQQTEIQRGPLFDHVAEILLHLVVASQ